MFWLSMNPVTVGCLLFYGAPRVASHLHPSKPGSIPIWRFGGVTVMRLPDHCLL